MKNTSLLASALLLAAPVTALMLPGCGGGSGGPNPTSTPVPTVTGTTAPTTSPTQGTTQTSNLTLSNGQRAVLSVKQNGNNLSGTLQILTAATGLRSATRAFNFSILIGTYSFTGTFSPPRGYSIQGNFGTLSGFSMTGQLPTATQAGSYSLTANGQTDTGTLAPYGNTIPTTGPTTTPGNYKLTGNLTFSEVSSGSDVSATSINSFNNFGTGGSLTTTTTNGSKFQVAALNGASGPASGNGTTRTLGIALSSYESLTNLRPFSVGQEFAPDITTGKLIQFTQTVVQGTSFKTGVWRSSSGKIIVKAIGTNSITLELQGVRFEPTEIFGGTGTFKLSGTLTGTGLTVVNQ